MGRQYIYKSRLTDIDSTPQDSLGAIREELNRVYKYVKFSGTTAIAAGDALCYVLTDTGLQTVDKANTALGAGIALAAVPSGAVAYGWVQTKGQSLTSWTVPGAAGNSLTTVGGTAPALAVSAAASSQDCAYVVVAGVAGTGVIACDFPV